MKKFTLGIVLSIVFLLTGAMQAQISTFPYQEGFEAGAGGWVASGTNSNWALGAPTNAIINSASEGTNAWVTGLATNYNTSADSYVTSPVFDFSALGADPTIKMDVWWNSEFSWDGANLQASTDGGTTWTRVGSFGDPNNWYTDDTVLGGAGGTVHAWTGRNSTTNGSGGWLEAEHLLDGTAGQASVTLRVFFGSDTSVTDEGFGFDNVRVTTVIGNAPAISCPADIMIDTTGGLCSGVANWTDALAIDVEDGPIPTTQTMGPPSGSTLPTGVTTIEYSATDSDGNTVTCQFTVTVTDNENPINVCQNITVELDAAGMYVMAPTEIDGGSTDNCGIVTYEFGTSGPAGSGSLPTIFVGTNGGATGGAVYFDVTVGSSNIDLTAIDVNTTTAAGDPFTIDVYAFPGTYVGNTGSPAPWGAALATGAGTTAGTDIPSTATLGGPVTLLAGTTYAMAIVMDGTHSHRYTNGDGTNQNYSNADLSMSLGAGGNTPFSGGVFSPRVFNGALTYDIVPDAFGGTFDCSMVGANTVYLKTTDANGNSSTCAATVTVEDNLAPVITCNGEPATVVDTTTATPALAIPDADPAGINTIMSVTDDFDIVDLDVDLDIAHSWVGDLKVTLTSPTGTVVVLIDQMGVPATAFGCSSDNLLVTIDDEATDPIEDACDAGPPAATGPYIGQEALSAFDGESTLGDWTLNVSDNAGGDTGTINGWGLVYSHDVSASPFDVILDANGMATVNAADLLLSIDEACAYTVTVGTTPVPTVLELPIPGGNGNFGNMFDVNALNEVTVDSFDVHGDVGLTFDVNVWFKTGTHVGFEADASAWTLLDTAVGIVSNGDGVVTPLNLTLGHTIPAGDTHAFFVSPIGGGFNYHNGTAVGAIAGADANIEVLEGSAADEAFSGTIFAPRVFEGNVIYTAGAGIGTELMVDCSDLGESTVEVTVTDASGNVSMCTATINVIDETAPILVCMDTTIELGPDGTAIVDPMALLAVMPSSYNVITISSDNQSGAPGETDLTVPVTADETISFDWDYSTADGPAFDSFGYLLNGVFTELTDPAGATNQNGSTTVALLTGDVFGFRSHSNDGVFGACTTVISNFMPGFTGQFDPANWTQLLTNSDGSATFVEIPGGPLSFDACGITILAVDVTEVSCDDIGTPIVITVFASDASGNIASCTSTVTVIDALAPVVTCPADQTVDPGVGNLFYEIPDYLATGEATAVDNCTDPLTITSQDPAAGTLVPDGVYPITITAEDEYGNVGTCTFTLTVESVLGVNDNELDIAITMYPNPAVNQVTISNNSNIQLEKAAIYDLNGKMISQYNLSNMQGEKVIDVSELATGVYMVQLISDKSSAVKRLIKE
ncbi:HYR domain-containing protein [Ulvibacter antarcticus]|uniref:Putative secreted protein (Por secretion system target) n=1 Tax=Ulvibacter antarcticus TaxID=442714 RepID=A0A3L9YQN1_9FLAO|nr:HYR domain-containing protein [Ulvibacter antarcticus]RMA56802.1 putative secreted protein (Por secretion system target) [Ulvibacter antarcticus]